MNLYYGAKWEHGATVMPLGSPVACNQQSVGRRPAPLLARRKSTGALRVLMEADEQ